MKKISLKMSNDFKIVPLCKNNIYALENNSAMIEIDCEVRSDLSYKLHIQSKNDKTVMLMDKGEHVITAMLKEPYISSNGVYYIQLEGVKSDYRIISNSIRFEVGSFINANHIPTPEEQGIIDQLVIRVGEVEEGLRIVELTAEEAKDLARNAVPLTLYDEDMTQIDARINESTETINWFVTEFSATINDLFENIVRIENDVEGLQGSKQDTLVSGENIATINGHNLLDGGDIEIQGGGGSGMEYYKVTFDGTHILHDGVALTFNDVVAKYNDDNYFLYAEVYGLTMIPTLPPYEGDNILEFICTWIENGAVTISRLIINALNQVKFEDVEVAKKSDIPTVPTKTSELTNDSGFITARDVPAPYDDTEIREEVSAVGEEVSSVKAGLSQLDTEVQNHETRIETLENTPIPESTVKSAVDEYVSTHSGGFATKSELEKVESVTISKTSESVSDNLRYITTFTDGFCTKTGTKRTDGSYASYKFTDNIRVSEGDVIRTDLLRVVTAYSGDVCIGEKGAESVSTYIVPSGIDSVILTVGSIKDIYHDYTIEDYDLICREELDELQATVSTHTEEIRALQENELEGIVYIDDYVQLSKTQGGYVNVTTGLPVISPTYADYEFSQKIACNEGDIVYPRRANGNASYFRWIAFFNGDSVVASAGISTNTKSFIIPSGVDGFIGSSSIAGASVSQVEIIRKTKFTRTNLAKVGGDVKEFNLNSGDKVELPYNSVKFNNVINFNGLIDSLGTVKIGKDSFITVDSNNLTVSNATVPHNLTIEHDLSITVENDTKQSIKQIVIASSGNEFRYTVDNVQFDMSNGSSFVESIGTTMHDCKLSWSSKSITNDIWLFGDSYFTYANTRWIWHLLNNGFADNCLIDGFAGRTSIEGLMALSNLLATGAIPRMVVWCLGMNDTDPSDSANIEWLYCFNALKELGKTFGFEIVLSTIPLVNAINNSNKNSVVKSSGYRYIDFSKAVNTTGNNWVSGALDSDGIHPTPKGANMLFHKAISDLPELCT